MVNRRFPGGAFYSALSPGGALLNFSVTTCVKPVVCHSLFEEGSTSDLSWPIRAHLRCVLRTPVIKKINLKRHRG